LLKIGVIGGGAAGFFAALRHKELCPDHQVIIFEKTSKLLGKVRISGGGRCNVTHACFEIKKLVEYFPRGSKELIGPFHRFQPSDTVSWFESRGVALKTEDDGRIFPVTDLSQTIIDCLINEANRLGVIINLKHELTDFTPLKESGYKVWFKDQETYELDRLIITTGSNENIWEVMAGLGHSIIPPVPSLFTFNIQDPRIKDFPGVSWPEVEIKIKDSQWVTKGPLLITHWGLSGPAVLKLSAIGAMDLHKLNYQFKVVVNFLYPLSTLKVYDELNEVKRLHSNKQITSMPIIPFTTRIWSEWMNQFGFGNRTWQNLSKKDLMSLSEKLTLGEFEVAGKSTFKEEFVTCGGIDLNEVDMKTMQSKKLKNVFFAGEVLNIDALTGGFNFQAAWTTGWIAGSTGINAQIPNLTSAS